MKRSKTSLPAFFTLDISRLLSRASACVPTGIDRVELEYARYLLTTAPDRVEFAAMHPMGRFAALPFSMASDFISAIGAMWDRGQGDAAYTTRLAFRLKHGILTPRLGSIARVARGTRPTNVYLLLSHHHLIRPAVVVAALKRRKRTLFVPMVHDLIPLEYPEYSRPREFARHRQRVETVVRYADAVLTPSEAVRTSLQPHFATAGREAVPIWAIPHGVHLRALDDEPDVTPVSESPYFVFLSTIEARKNHLLLLNIWRRLVEEHGAAAPKLIIVGKRGWENEQVLDMLERCPALQGFVEEHNALPDTQVVSLLRGARALLFPSFTEGFGLPLAEALALGTPAICSDIPVFREVGGTAAHYVDPLDGLEWMRRIDAFARMTAQEARALNRSGHNPGIDWRESVSRALGQIEAFAARQ
ncbi:glycosyltransferase family 4 protein [Brytella acorum]|uniref:Glycosyltransferase family 1 protein n=1 Tax=Brytella acorum TaxID=2959299 RepID=A0AA35XWI3_9PROT|nr:glycosyltransferase family 1 protein [Brytella acorum]MDF3625323.1 glycosyltransferase family 1 protein [Brytella acorum]CAI9119263.1 glycosyltransferase family 1 protein [Brytella acorum]